MTHNYTTIFIVETYTTMQHNYSCINYHTNEYITAKGVTNMLIKINKKPIVVEEETDKEGVDWVYMIVTCCGYLLVLCLLDYSSYLFIGKHIFPFLQPIIKMLLWVIQ